LMHLEQLLAIPVSERPKLRYAKFRNFGHFNEKPPPSIQTIEAGPENSEVQSSNGNELLLD
jgi:hypothetical protein